MYGSTIVAAAQFVPAQGDVRHNIAAALQVAFEATLAGARLVVLPELCTSGPEIFTQRDAALAAQPFNGWQTREFAALSAITGAYIIFGYVEISGGCYYNSCVLVGPQGVLANFRKRNLWGSDYFWATASPEKRGQIVLTPIGRIGALICRDVQNHDRDATGDQTEYYAARTVDVLAVPASWDATPTFPHSDWVELAEKTGATVVVANRAPMPAEDNFAGGSCIISPSLGIVHAGRTGTRVLGAEL